MSFFGFYALPHLLGEASLQDVLLFHLRGVAAAERAEAIEIGRRRLWGEVNHLQGMCSGGRTRSTPPDRQNSESSGFSGSVIAPSPMASTKTLGLGLGRQVLQPAVEQNIAFTVCSYMGGDLHPSAQHGLQRCCFLS